MVTKIDVSALSASCSRFLFVLVSVLPSPPEVDISPFLQALHPVCNFTGKCRASSFTCHARWRKRAFGSNCLAELMPLSCDRGIFWHTHKSIATRCIGGTDHLRSNWMEPGDYNNRCIFCICPVFTVLPDPVAVNGNERDVLESFIHNLQFLRSTN